MQFSEADHRLPSLTQLSRQKRGQKYLELYAQAKETQSVTAGYLPEPLEQLCQEQCERANTRVHAVKGIPVATGNRFNVRQIDVRQMSGRQSFGNFSSDSQCLRDIVEWSQARKAQRLGLDAAKRKKSPLVCFFFACKNLLVYIIETA